MPRETDPPSKSETGGPKTDPPGKRETGGPKTDPPSKSETGGPKTEPPGKRETGGPAEIDVARGRLTAQETLAWQEGINKLELTKTMRWAISDGIIAAARLIPVKRAFRLITILIKTY